MTTRIFAAGPSTNVAVSPTAARTTAPPARPFHQVMRAGAEAIVSSAETAAARLPGGSLLVAAMRGAPETGGSVTSPVGPTASAEIGGGAAGTSTGTSTGGTSSIESVLDQNADQNLYFLGLQERISQENRSFTTVSNVLKARHETVKNAIGNIR